MQINHKVIKAILKWGSIAIFVYALGHKLYQIYKYGGKQSTNSEPTDDAYEPQEVTEKYSDYDED